MKKFNTTGSCNPERHYMVNIQKRLAQIKEMIDDGKYFSINKGRQYGKTTTLKALSNYLNGEYIVIRLAFQGNMTSKSFSTEETFSETLAGAIHQRLKQTAYYNILKPILKKIDKAIEKSKLNLVTLFGLLSDLCAESPKGIVLMIDEVDQASSNQVFLDFLGQLRYYYLERDALPTFQSVILAGVHDIRNLKRKLRPDEAHQHNSPWNIAADFDVEMSFSQDDIEGMLKEYEADHHTGMNIPEMAKLIYEDTAGYPVLVSSFCRLMDERLPGTESSAWTKEGFLRSEKILLTGKVLLFDSLIDKLRDNDKLRTLLKLILFDGESIPYNADNDAIDLAAMYGFVTNRDGQLSVFNRIFETRIYDWFLSEDVTSIKKISGGNKNQFVDNGKLNMERVLEKFVADFDFVYGSKDDRFKEEVGRRLFLLYLKPIINGTGYYYIEPRTRDDRRMDVVVNYGTEQHIVELKIWHGDKYNADGEKQLSDYLDYHHLKKGYLLTFNFNKKKEIGIRHVQYADKELIEATV